ncbi:hypothetical protein JK203_14825 [Gluconobacter cerinus]|uniref:hypothetical protein n=1 Tax=Gluconobacter TaxID=441 RepID=UPI001B8C136B|nr:MULTISPECIES: hypothetical protein [Gluconobacter]MBS1036021.1 hypothetical protein [Gluconobacter cerinus]MBS1042100.1 hypothetical protein [Gluconobacter cerinus]MBS1048681.1 hypothetical protein [Gluconobacter cerinus]MBS1072935.1 hypothetical protein [Gluconobacter cerinus]MCW2267096.1 biotin carboxyl carrier protein [Gluconobacter cerinus]
MTMLDRIESFVTLMRSADLASLSLREGNETLELQLYPKIAAADQICTNFFGDSAAFSASVKSPEVGIFRLVDIPSERWVKIGDIVGYIDIDPLRVSVIAPETGRLSTPLHEDGAVVGYGDLLFMIEEVKPA